MRVIATGPGKTGTIDQGLGRLVLSHPTDDEKKKLLLIYSIS